MKTIDLAINKNYLKGKWGLREGVREIVQNCLDTDDYSISFSNGGTLSLKTFAGTLDISDFALGTTSKAEDAGAIGQYGEGLKVGILGILRDGHSVEIRNGHDRIIPVIDESDTFKCETLQMLIDEGYDNSADGNCVNISISDVEPYEVEGIALELDKAINGNLCYTKAAETEYGIAIFDEEYKGKIYVGGLYVQTEDSLEYGFDFKPQFISLDRDRKAIGFWDLMNSTAQLIDALDDAVKSFGAYIGNSYQSEYVINHLGEMSGDSQDKFYEIYLSKKRKAIGFDGMPKDANIHNSIAVTEQVRDYLLANDLVPAGKYLFIEDDDDNIRKHYNEYLDHEQYASELEDKAEAWNKKRNVKDEELVAFNSSAYKLLTAVKNELSGINGVSAQAKASLIKLIASADTKKFSKILPLIDERKIGYEDYEKEDFME